MTTTTNLGELTGDYVLDTSRSRIGFVARHTIGPRVQGQFDAFEGNAHLDGDDPAASNVQVTIQPMSIQTDNQRRDAYLRSKFLDVDHHPTMTFTSTGVEQVDRTRFTLTGDLTVRGATKPVAVSFELTGTQGDPSGSLRASFEGSVPINRKDWGVRWTAAAGMVSKTVTLEFDVVVIRRS